MLYASLAIGWPLWRRHRWGLVATLSILSFAILLTSLLTATGTDRETVNIFLIPITMILVLLSGYGLAIFTFGVDADVNGRESCFPVAMFRLPIKTGFLVGWPMLYGAAVAALFWFICTAFILRPWGELWGVQLPLWWPTALAVATLAWFQALLWVPVGLPVLRMLLIAILIPGLVALTEIFVLARASEQFLVSMFLCLAASAWTLCYVGVRYARHGALPNWSMLLIPVRSLARRQPRLRAPFRGSAHAQMWFEWRRTGLALPFLTALLLPFMLLPLMFGTNDAIPASRTILSVFFLPVFMAGLAGTTVSGNHPWVKDYYGVTPSTATLPLSTAALVAAKLRAALISTLVSWTMLISVVVFVLVFTQTLADMRLAWERVLGEMSPLKTVAAIMAAWVYLALWTWKRLVDSILLGLTGRKWIIQGNVVVSLTVLFAIVGLVAYIYRNPETHGVALTLLPWLLALWALGRLAAAGWLIRRLLHEKLVTRQTLWRWFGGLLLLGFVLFGIFVWVIPASLLPRVYLGFAVLLALPMAHLAATPLALAWNRHR